MNNSEDVELTQICKSMLFGIKGERAERKILVGVGSRPLIVITRNQTSTAETFERKNNRQLKRL